LQPEILSEGMSWFSATRVGPDLTAFTEPFLNDFFRANFYLLRGRDRDLFVDTGMGLAPLMPALALTPSHTPGKPLLAVATHIHADHVGSLAEFAERAGPALEAEAFVTMDDRMTFADMFRDMDDPVSVLPHAGWRAADYRIHPAPLTLMLAEGDRIDLGDRSFTVLELPGHSRDSIALYDEKDGLLFSGDAIYDDELIDDLWCSDVGQYRAIMRRLLELPVRAVHGGHGASFGQQRMREIAQQYLARTEG
jgi:glyoxylase-like metal-dependent hydrolase (beta-lactamase superfamily II)